MMMMEEEEGPVGKVDFISGFILVFGGGGGGGKGKGFGGRIMDGWMGMMSWFIDGSLRVLRRLEMKWMLDST